MLIPLAMKTLKLRIREVRLGILMNKINQGERRIKFWKWPHLSDLKKPEILFLHTFKGPQQKGRKSKSSWPLSHSPPLNNLLLIVLI